MVPVTAPLRSAPQQHRSRATLERIIEAANVEFASAGLAKASTSAIAERAGVSIGTLYRFFDDKDAIAQALVDRYQEDAAERYAPKLAPITDAESMIDALRAVIAAAAEMQLRHPGYYRITVDHPPDLDGSPAAEVRAALIDEFDAAVVRIGSQQEPARRRTAIALCIETVRHTLARAPLEGDERDFVVTELEAMIVAYGRKRLGVGDTSGLG